MEIKAQIVAGIRYKPILKCELREISFDDFEINSAKSFCLISAGQNRSSTGDVKDGLLKMMLYTNLENVTIDGKSLKSLPILRLTSAKLNGRISSNSSIEARDEFYKANDFSKRQKEFLSDLFVEAAANSFTVSLGQI